MRVKQYLRAVALALALGIATMAPAIADDHDDAVVERGRYLAKIAGCNDCHTPGYPQAAGPGAARSLRDVAGPAAALSGCVACARLS